MAQIRLIVGLGNPGPDYENTRHNAGFWFLDRLALKQSVFFHEEKKFFGQVAKVRIANQEVWLLKPSTYMNRSGQAVVALALYYKILPEEILVVHDEMDLLPGCMKVKKGVASEVPLKYEGTFRYLDTEGRPVTDVTKKRILPSETMAPVKKGEQAGELIYYRDGQELGKLRILYGEDVAKAGYSHCLKKVLDCLWL